MACEKHRQSLSDATLGELDPRRELELLAHAGECDACRESYNHGKELRDNIDRAIGAIVAGEPSPNFASRLRARIATEPRPTWAGWFAWVPLGTGAMILAGLLMTFLIRTDRRASFDAVAVPSAPTTSSDLQASRSASPSARASRSLPRGHRASGDSVVPSHVNEPVVLVPKGQLAAALKLREAVSNGGVDGQQFVVAPQRREDLLDVAAIEVAPLEKPAPLADEEQPGDR